MNILVIEDQNEVRYAIKRVLEREGHTPSESSGEGWRDDLETLLEGTDLAVLDVMLGEESGIEILRALRIGRPHLPVILITAYTTPENIVEASRLGVTEILQKPFDGDELLAAIARHKPEPAQKSAGARIGGPEGGAESFVGSFETMGEVFKRIGLVAANDLSVLLIGATGTGKEMAARMIHRFSARKDKPFVAINCAAIPHDLFESEFFGHEKGAFTGADKLKIGSIESADGGVLFLDEIGEMPKDLQSKLLRYLESKQFRRVGGTKELISDVRIVSATNVDIQQNIQNGTFREDLYYRLAQLSIPLPRLRERLADLPLLSRHFIARANKELLTQVTALSDAALEKLKGHPWEGNVREFRNVIFNACLSAQSGAIEARDIKLQTCNTADNCEQLKSLVEGWLYCKGTEGAQTLANFFEKTLLEELLHKTRGNISQSAAALGITRNTLKARLKHHGLSAHDDEHPPHTKEHS